MTDRKSHAVSLAIGLAFTGPAVAVPRVFEGRIEASERAVLSSRLDGVVAEILFEGGDPVTAGQPLIRLDPTVTIRARFPNPDALLRPGMAVTVLSRIARAEIAR